MPVPQVAQCRLVGAVVGCILWGSQTQKPVACISVSIQHSDRPDSTIKVMPRWAGANLAVHRKIVRRDDINGMGQAPKSYTLGDSWVVTHLHTGYVAAKFPSLKKAVMAAQLADDSFRGVTAEELKADKDMVNAWKDLVRSMGGFVG